MKRLVLCCLAFSLLIFAATKERDWKIGKLLDSTASTRHVTVGPSSTTCSPSPQIVCPNTYHIEVKTNRLTILGDGYVYTAETKRNNRFIVGDEIKYAQDKRSLYVLDADGKECRLDIVRQEKAPTGKSQ
jgi:hypothetical protein